jgi:hypothetical protein
MAIGAAACLVLAGAASSHGAGKSSAVGKTVTIDFGGAGDEQYVGSNGADIASASVLMSWHLQWKLATDVSYGGNGLSERLTAEDVDGSSKIDYGRPNTPNCSGPVKANTTVVGKEHFEGRPNNQLALPNPMIIGFAAEPCWAYGGGGTAWFAIRGNPDPAVERRIDDEIAYTTIPLSFLDTPSYSCPPQAEFAMTYPNAVGGGTHTITVRWWGLVRVAVNGKSPTISSRSRCGYTLEEQIGDELLGAVGLAGSLQPGKNASGNTFGIIDLPLPPPSKSLQSVLPVGPIKVNLTSGTLLLARGSATVGKSASLRLRPTSAGKKALRRPLGKPLRVTVTVTYAGKSFRKAALVKK